MSDSSITRREVLKRTAGTLAVAAAAGGLAWWLRDDEGPQVGVPPKHGGVTLPNYFAKIDWPGGYPRLSIVVGSIEQIDEMVNRAITALTKGEGLKRLIQPGDVVLIKPNVGFDRPPQMGATTHPQIVAAVAKLCFEARASQVLVADNPIESPAACFAKSRIQTAAEAAGAKVVWPAGSDFERLTLRDRPPDPARGEALGSWPVYTGPLVQATKLIGIAPVKDHNLSSASMNLKNWYGLLGGRRNQFHQAIHEIVSDLALAFSPTLVIADATRVMMRNGPTGGRLSDVQPGGVLGRPAIVAAVDPVACDAWCYQQLLGRDPAQLAYLELAQSKIAERIAAGKKRFGSRDWSALKQQGLIARVSLDERV